MSDRLTALIYQDNTGTPDVSLAPLTDLRPAFLVRTGALTTLERHQHDPRLRIAGVLVPASDADLTREQCQVPVNEPPTDVTSVLLINARCPILPQAAHSLGVGEALIEGPSTHVIAAHLKPTDVARFIGDPKFTLAAQVHDKRALLSRPWHVRTFRDACLSHDLRLLSEVIARLGGQPPTVAVTMGDRAIAIHNTATICAGVTLDAEDGPIVIDDAATIRPGAILIGPCYVGPHTTILERATIRPGTAIGPWCKVNGEVGGTIFQGYANKAHDGYLGDSHIGEWVNLGAGTTNSNLLNTYGETTARATPAGKHERTGEQFLGAIIGDHVKTAIGSRIMTASVLGTGSMFATTAPVSGTFDALSWVTDAGIKPYRAEKFVEVMEAAMARRKVTPTAAYRSRIHSMLPK